MKYEEKRKRMMRIVAIILAIMLIIGVICTPIYLLSA
jgi:energy-converting hydrogenase Eha subunit F